jgi:hypothetical protein
MTQYFCCDERRREAVQNSSGFNGIDFLEVVDSDATNPSDRQRVLHINFLRTPAPAGLTPANVQITGGDRISGIVADGVSYASDVLVVHVNTPGDFSTYTFRLVKTDQKGQPLDAPPDGIDPQLSMVTFSFKVECPSDFDCRQTPVCQVVPPTQPEISYLAKDFASFRQLMLDRMAVLVPAWQERHTADLGIALVELLAYVGDYLSYRQDAVATEAYLGTARRRVSIRRHARLVDYFLHNGSNARVWVQVQVSSDQVPLPKGTQLFSRLTNQPVFIVPGSALYSKALNAQPVVFETQQDAVFFKAHNQIKFYTWGDQRCSLPKGTTSATLLGSYPHLSAGSVLIFEEVLGAVTGQPQDADPSRRCAVRLTTVIPNTDPLGGEFSQPPNTTPVDVTEITWALDDALPFPFCLSTQVSGTGGPQEIPDVSVARGNVVLADHGLTVASEDLGAVPASTLFQVSAMTGTPCQQSAPTPIPPRYYPSLQQKPLTCASLYDNAASANATQNLSPQNALPQLSLSAVDVEGRKTTWRPQQDLLSSGTESLDFVVETESDGTAYLRFGDGQNGFHPLPGTTFTATYRTGNGTRGNVAAEAIAHVVAAEPAVIGVRNPLPGVGGVEMENLEDARRNAPFAFRTQERAVTPDDYVKLALRNPQVRQAAATFRWTGSWYTVFLTVDRVAGLPVDDAFRAEIDQQMETFRVEGYDLVINAPRFVPLEIEMIVLVQCDYFRSDVEAALLQIFSSGILPDGKPAIFNPLNFGFGQRVYISPLYAAAQAVAGVASTQITTFQRQGDPRTNAANASSLQVDRLEVPLLDNDPNFPERGVFRLNLEGGK